MIKNSLFKENFQESVNLKIRNFGKLMINLEIKRFKILTKETKANGQNSNGTAETVPAVVQLLQAGAELKIKATIEIEKNMFSWTQIFFPCGGMAVVTSYTT